MKTEDNPIVGPRRSQTIGELAEALSKAQRDARNICEGEVNQGLRFSYVAVGQVMPVAREALGANGLAMIIDTVATSENSDGKWTHALMTCDITLLHSSGEWMTTRWLAEAKDAGDKLYSKLYTAALKTFAMKTLLISSKVDDDADAFDPPPRPATPTRSKPTPKPKPTEPAKPKELSPKDKLTQRFYEAMRGTGDVGKAWLECYLKRNQIAEVADIADIEGVTSWLEGHDPGELVAALEADTTIT